VRLVAYLRVSSETQTDGYGLTVQQAEVREWARRNGHKIVKIHTDAGMSGAKSYVDRPGLSAAIADVCEYRTAEGLLIPKLDRLAREVTVQEAALAFVWRNGGQVFAADQGEVMRDDPDDPYRTAMRQMAGVFADLERMMIVKRMRDGRKAKAAAGRKAVGQYAYGYRGEGKGRERDAAPDPDEQKAVRIITKMRREAHSYRTIATHLDETGLKPRKAERWSAMSVRSVALRHGAA
jgi:DNA invertase Pin-like site-specific DNA recombinase